MCGRSCSGKQVISTGANSHCPSGPEQTRAMTHRGLPPWTNDSVWVQCQGQLRNFPGQVSMLELCAGMGTSFLAAQLLLGKDKVAMAGCWDVDPNLRPVLEFLHGHGSPAVHVGPDMGDIVRCDVASFPSANIITAGPPCPPYSSMGKRAGLRDRRAKPFYKTIDIIAHQARRQQGRPILLFS